MLYVDIPTRDELAALIGVRVQGAVSIYLRTSPITAETKLGQIEFGNFIREAEGQLQALALPKGDIAAIIEELEDLAEDDGFWATQAHSLAIFATPGFIRTFRLPNDLTPVLVVSDRLYVKPLFRAVTFPHAAYVLALSENAVRLIEVDTGLPPQEVRVESMPKDAASAAGLASIKGRSHYRRMHGTEGQNVRLTQFARKVDAALRPVLIGQETPLILAATGRLASLFRQVNSYPHLLDHSIDDSPDRMSEGELAAAARPVLDESYKNEVAALHNLFSQRAGESRVTTDISDAARAATFGAIQTLMVDIDAIVPGHVDDQTGAVTFADIKDVTAHGVIDEITARAFDSGARILGLRREDIPGDSGLAVILRHPL